MPKGDFQQFVEDILDEGTNPPLNLDALYKLEDHHTKKAGEHYLKASYLSPKHNSKQSDTEKQRYQWHRERHEHHVKQAMKISDIIDKVNKPNLEESFFWKRPESPFKKGLKARIDDLEKKLHQEDIEMAVQDRSTGKPLIKTTAKNKEEQKILWRSIRKHMEKNHLDNMHLTSHKKIA